MCAQDTKTREVMIKPVLLDSDEHRIYELVKSSPAAFSEDDFCCVLPAVDILEYDNEIVLAVMPR